jgi:hypothetical protein
MEITTSIIQSIFFLLDQGKSPVGFLASKCDAESKNQERSYQPL